MDRRGGDRASITGLILVTIIGGMVALSSLFYMLNRAFQSESVEDHLRNNGMIQPELAAVTSTPQNILEDGKYVTVEV